MNHKDLVEGQTYDVVIDGRLFVYRLDFIQGEGVKGMALPAYYVTNTGTGRQEVLHDPTVFKALVGKDGPPDLSKPEHRINWYTGRCECVFCCASRAESMPVQRKGLLSQPTLF